MLSSFTGAAPVIAVRPIEREIYRQMWERPEYREVAPGESCAMEFLKQARPKQGASVLDLGCGTGRGALSLAVFGAMDVTMVDFADNCLDADIRPMLETQKHTLRFLEADLTKPLPAAAEYGFCTDVLEHIPPGQVDAVLDNCLHACQHVFFQISTVDDVCGALIGHPLHLSVHPYSWWLQKFNERGCTVHWSRDDGASCMFYVSAWVTGEQVVDAGILNTEEEQVRANVRANIEAGWQQVSPHETNDLEVMILGGGPTMAQFEDDIRAKRAAGVKLVTLNGAYNWALEHGLTPSAQVMVDARGFNARFTKPVVDSCKYLLASQCDPAVFEGLPKENTYIWHTTTDMIRDVLNELCEVWYGVPGGSTVLLRAIPLLRMLGYRKFHLYGCDSCLIGEAHHSFSQPENDGQPAMPVTVGGRVFMCHAWMAAQAQEFISLIKYLGEEIELEVYGDGLLNHILQTGAELSEEE